MQLMTEEVAVIFLLRFTEITIALSSHCPTLAERKALACATFKPVQ